MPSRTARPSARVVMPKEKVSAEYQFSSPLILDPFFADSSRQAMKEEANQSPAKLKAFNELYGKDRRCPNWDPVNHLGDDVEALYQYDPLDTRIDVTAKVKFLLHYSLFSYLRETLLIHGSPMPLALFHPGDASIPDEDGKCAAVYRHAIIYRYFDSTQQFWEEFEQVYEEIKGFRYAWPYPTPHLNLSQCRQSMQEAGDEFGVKMASMIFDTLGESEIFTESAMEFILYAWGAAGECWSE